MNTVTQVADSETPGIKPGNKTSEHKMAWASILGIIGLAAGTIATGGIAGIPPVAVTIASVIAVALTSAGYSVSRGMAKS